LNTLKTIFKILLLFLLRAMNLSLGQTKHLAVWAWKTIGLQQPFLSIIPREKLLFHKSSATFHQTKTSQVIWS
jgi:hypothetical protein